MLFDEVPNTSTYMIAGYAIFFIVSLIYLASLFIRNRNLARDLEAVEDLKEEEEVPAPTQAPRAKAQAKTARPKTGKSGQARKKTARKR